MFEPEDKLDWEPSYGFCATSTQDNVALATALEAVRRRICAYGPQARTCDCKFGISLDGIGYSEQTGCPELREMIHRLLHRPGTFSEGAYDEFQRGYDRGTGNLSDQLRKLLDQLTDPQRFDPHRER